MVRAETHPVLVQLQLQGRNYSPEVLVCQVIGYRVADIEVEGVGMVRAWAADRASEYWTERVHLQKWDQPIQIVICSDRDSCLPVPVVDLAHGTYHDEYSIPVWFSPDKRSTRAGSAVLLGMLLCGMQAAYDIIDDDDFPEPTRYRYLAKMKQLMKRKRGAQTRIGRALAV